MLQINLLPPEEKKRKRKQIELPDISFIPVIAMLLGIIIIVHLFLGMTLALKVRTIKTLEKKWDTIAEDKKKADKLKFELTIMRDRIDAIDSLIKNRHSWAKKLNSISDSMISAVWLNKMWIERKVVMQQQQQEAKEVPAKDSKIKTERQQSSQSQPKKLVTRTLHINGSVIALGGEETATVGKFIRSLKENQNFYSDFYEIESASIQRTKLKDEEVLDFELICYFK